MSKEQNVVDFYVLCNKLKNIVRTGWKNWNVKKERIESVAEHIFGVQMLAIAMQSEFNYPIDIKKVLTMIAIHETEEIVIGDLTLFDISKDEKDKLGHDAVKNIFSKLSNARELENLIYEFDERKTNEARFAYFCDKLEADIQAKIYDEQNCVDLSNQPNNPSIFDKDVQELLKSDKSWAQMWLTFGQRRYNYDENFLKISNYVMNNDILKK